MFNSEESEGSDTWAQEPLLKLPHTLDSDSDPECLGYFQASSSDSESNQKEDQKHVMLLIRIIVIYTYN